MTTEHTDQTGVTHYTNRDEWCAACDAAGLRIVTVRPYREGMHPDDMFDPEVAYDATGNPVGAGSWEPADERGDSVVWSGDLAVDADTYHRWQHEYEHDEPDPREDPWEDPREDSTMAKTNPVIPEWSPRGIY